MAYKLSMAANAMRIDTQEYALMKTNIRFSEINSCVGIIVQTGKFVSGFHLVQEGVDDSGLASAVVFDANARVKLMNILDHLPVPSVDRVKFIGWWNYWLNGMPAVDYRNPQGQIVSSYPAQTGNADFIAFEKALVAKGVPVVRDPVHRSDGRFAAQINAAYPNEITVTTYRCNRYLLEIG